MKNKLLLGSVFSILFIEILFSPVYSLIYFLFSQDGFRYNYEYFIDSQFFLDNPSFLFIALLIELLGVTGLFIWNIKHNDKKVKYLIYSICFILFLSLTLILYLGFYTQNGIGF